MATRSDDRRQSPPAARPSARRTVQPRPAPRPASLVVRPFQWLDPRPTDAGGDPRPLGQDLGYLQILTADADVRVARALVEHTLARASRQQPPAVTLVNRRLRVARLWINAILAGDVSPRTLGHVCNDWLPTLSGHRHPHTAAIRAGRDTVEMIRGLLTASIFADPWPCLLRHARAMHALETVLAAHLGAILQTRD